jgi:alpha-glucosidase
VTRHVTRYGRADTTFSFADRRHGEALDLELGTRRARAAALLTLALPGAVYLYQGEELGLWEVEDLPPDIRQDPIWHRNGGTDPGRDGCRVPMPWSGTEPPFGFSPDGAAAPPWLPQPLAWQQHTIEAETGAPASMLELYRTALYLRRTEPALRGPAELMHWLPAAPGVLAFRRSSAGYDSAGQDSAGQDSVACVINLSGEPAELPGHTALLLASQPTTNATVPSRTLPPDTAVWIRLNPG